MKRDILSDILKEVRSALELKYERDNDYVKEIYIADHKANVRMEAIQTAAMAIRFLENFK